MKRILLFILTLSLLLLASTGCEIIDGITGKSNDEDPHTHTGGTATCKSEAICTVCGEPYGEKRMSHDYYDATCIAPKTCKDCGVTFGLPLGHSYEAATCQSASTCTVSATDYYGNTSSLTLNVTVGTKDVNAPVIQFTAKEIHVAVGTYDRMVVKCVDDYDDIDVDVKWSNGAVDFGGRL